MQMEVLHRLPLWAAAFLFLLLKGCTGSSHSLRYLTAIWETGQGPPKFIGLGYVDDQLFAAFNSNMGQTVPRAPWKKKVKQDYPDFWKLFTRTVSILQQRNGEELGMLKKHLNQSQDVLTWQRRFGCDLKEDGQTEGYSHHAYNGRNVLSFDKENLTWTAVDPAAEVFKRQWEGSATSAWGLKTYLEETCIEWFQIFLAYAKESLMRREPPVVKVMQKVNQDKLESLICRAYGFYPKEINIVWRKGEEVWVQNGSRGGVLPNSDGTYHTWISIKLNPQNGDLYQCYVEHAGLVKPLSVAWAESASVWSIVGGILGAAAAALLLVAGIILCIKQRQDSYKATSASGQEAGEATAHPNGRNQTLHLDGKCGEKTELRGSSWENEKESERFGGTSGDCVDSSC